VVEPAVRRPPSTAVLGGGIVALAAVLAVVGFFVGHATGGGGESKKAATGGSTANAGNVTAAYPASWHRLATQPKIPGLRFGSPIALGPRSTQAAGLVVGTVPPNWPSFIPQSFLRKLLPSDPVEQREIVRIGDSDVFRYQDLSPKGYDGTVKLFVLPQSGKPTTAAACFVKGSAPTSLFSACEAVVGGITVRGVKPYPLVLPKAYASALNGALSPLERARATGVKQLQSAGSSSAQASAARSITSAYGKAIGQLTGAPATAYVQPANADILAALRSTRSAYADLATAASAKSESGYNAARSLVAKHERELHDAVEQLETLGFSVSS
jgi:hypothetical protein